MKILITGAAGALGSAICRLATEDGDDVIGYDVVSDPDSAAGTFITGDVLERDKLFAAAEGCDVIHHTAALHAYFLETHSHADFIRANVVGADNIYAAALEHDIRRVVLSSTMEVVIGHHWHANGIAVVDENTPPNPDVIYPVTKRQCEILADFYYRQHGITSALMRYMWFERKYPHPYGWGLGLLARCIETDDAARANLAAGRAATIGCDVFHIGPQTPLTNRDLEGCLTDQPAVLENHFPGCVEILASAGVDLAEPLWPVTRIARAKQLLGWGPRYTFTDYLKDLQNGRTWPHPIDRTLPES